MQSGSSTNEDRRLFERFPTRFPAKHKDTREEFGEKVYLRDASAQGVRFTTKERPFLNDSLALEVGLPDGLQPMLLKGQVVWTKNSAPNVWDVGLQFHSVSLMRMNRMFRYAAEAM